MRAHPQTLSIFLLVARQENSLRTSRRGLIRRVPDSTQRNLLSVLIKGGAVDTIWPSGERSRASLGRSCALLKVIRTTQVTNIITATHNQTHRGNQKHNVKYGQRHIEQRRASTDSHGRDLRSRGRARNRRLAENHRSHRILPRLRLTQRLHESTTE